jgi:hypothetical protein
MELAKGELLPRRPQRARAGAMVANLKTTMITTPTMATGRASRASQAARLLEPTDIRMESPRMQSTMQLLTMATLSRHARPRPQPSTTDMGQVHP